MSALRGNGIHTNCSFNPSSKSGQIRPFNFFWLFKKYLCDLLSATFHLEQNKSQTLKPCISRTDRPIRLKFHSNSVHCLYWIALKFEADRSIRSSWDTWSQSLWFFAPNAMEHLGRGGSIVFYNFFQCFQIVFLLT